ncbi:hypothetical protein EVG20_g1617 [Dentipellis fragilis]|uniref:F-box domain-containing protein n=1 Tax=Dentipellis fragilis TaxID=205917 RepID=A0A4Y9ZB63_9AGAM|nr:hypothetical protein EVG20_g1617 [Dentipellis fragilis]
MAPTFTFPALNADCTALILDWLDKQSLLVAACLCRGACQAIRPRLVRNVSITQLGKLMHFCHFVFAHKLASSIHAVTLRVLPGPHLNRYLGSFCDVLEMACNLRSFVVYGSTQALISITGSPRVAVLVAGGTIPLTKLEMEGIDPSGLHALRTVRGLSCLAFSFAPSWNPGLGQLTRIIQNSSDTLTEITLRAVYAMGGGARWTLKANAGTSFAPCAKMRRLSVQDMDVEISFLASGFPRLEHLALDHGCLMDTTGILGEPVCPNLKSLNCPLELVSALRNSNISNLRRLSMDSIPEDQVACFADALACFPLRRLYLGAFLHRDGPPRDISPVQDLLAHIVPSVPGLRVMEVKVYGILHVNIDFCEFVHLGYVSTISWPKDIKYMSMSLVDLSSPYDRLAPLFIPSHESGLRWFHAIPSLEYFEYTLNDSTAASFVRRLTSEADGTAHGDEIECFSHIGDVDPTQYEDLRG